MQMQKTTRDWVFRNWSEREAEEEGVWLAFDISDNKQNGLVFLQVSENPKKWNFPANTGRYYYNIFQLTKTNLSVDLYTNLKP